MMKILFTWIEYQGLTTHSNWMQEDHKSNPKGENVSPGKGMLHGQVTDNLQVVRSDKLYLSGQGHQTLGTHLYVSS